jgi:hypothetical protein
MTARSEAVERALLWAVSFVERSKFRLHYREAPPMFICVCEAASDDSAGCTCPHPAFQQGCRPDCEACALVNEKAALLTALRAALALPREEDRCPICKQPEAIHAKVWSKGNELPECPAPPPPQPTERSEDDRLLEEAIDSTCPGLDEAYRLNQELARLDRASEGKGGKP